MPGDILFAWFRLTGFLYYGHVRNNDGAMSLRYGASFDTKT